MRVLSLTAHFAESGAYLRSQFLPSQFLRSQFLLSHRFLLSQVRFCRVSFCRVSYLLTRRVNAESYVVVFAVDDVL